MVKIQVKTPRAIRRAKRRKFFESLLGGACVNCQATKQLEFDHVIPEDKSFNLATSCMEYSLETILPELQKCQLLCRSCHIRKTISDRGFNVERHGTPGMYSNRGCRCSDCRKSWAPYTRKNSEKYYYRNIEQERQKRREYSAVRRIEQVKIANSV